MKIAIIEDRIGRLDQSVEFDIRGCKEVTIITGADFDKLIVSLEAKDTTPLNIYDCIASHRSALNNEIRDTIKEYCKVKSKPLIFFSGGISSSVFKDIDFPFLHINSKDFYSSNLKIFIDNYQKNNIINLLILQFGNRWKLSLLLGLRNRISIHQNLLKLKNEGFEIDTVIDENWIRRLKDLRINEYIKSDLIREETKEIFNKDENSSISAEQIKEVKSVINHLINETA